MKQIIQENKQTLLYIAIAYIFSVAMRFIWVFQFQDYAPFHFNGAFMINTNDGYYWAEGARDILAGVAPESSPVHSAPAVLTAFFAKILPFSFENVIFYMPAFLSSLIVIPIILISKTLKNLEMGLIAGLLSGIAWSYYNRTMAGYYDSDMLNIVLPMFLLWSIIWAVNTHKNIYLLVTAIDILIYRWWYPQSYSLEFAFFALILIYALVFERKNLYYYKLLAIMLFAMMNGDAYVRLFLVLGSFYLFSNKKYEKYLFYILGVAGVAFLVSGGLDPIWYQIKVYLFRESVSNGSEGLGLHFFTVMQTVREAGHISFETFANRISGSVIIFVLSLVGYGFLLYKNKIMLFSLPLVGLGFVAYVGGLRFTVYAVPVLAMGIAFLITQVAYKMPTKKLQYLSGITFTLLILLPNYLHIKGYKVPTVFNVDEVKVLEQLKHKAQRDDYAIGWWDYGFPIRYYADVNTLADGAQHSGDRNFPISYILTQPQEESAKMARLDVAYEEKKSEKNVTSSLIEQMTKDYGFNDTNDFLLSLQTDIKLPKKTKDIYLYLPYRMLNIYPTVTLFSNLDLMTGNARKRPFFYMSRRSKDVGDKIFLGSGIVLNKKNATLTIGNKTVPIRRFVKTAYDKQGKLHVHEQLINFSSNFNVIYMSNYGTFLVVDEKTYNSTYIQLFVLEHYNKSLYEKVILSPSVKIYKLKI